MRIAFLFPPQWTAAQPHYSIALLAGQLGRVGHEVVVEDLNLALWEQVLAGRTSQLSLYRLQAEQQLLGTEVMLRQATADKTSAALTSACEKLAFFDNFLAGRHQGPPVAEGAADLLCRPDSFYDPTRFVSAFEALDESLRWFSAPYYPTRVAWNHVHHPSASLNMGPLLELCDDRQHNPFFDFYSDRLDEITDLDAEVFAISISSYSQVLGGLTLARMLKRELGGKAHLSLGGNFFSRLSDALRRLPAFFDAFADSVAIGEGEVPMVGLAQALDGRKPTPALLRGVPSLLFVDEAGDVEATAAAPQQPMTELAFQDLSAFNLDAYLSAERVICLRASKGCYWGACTFCDSYHGLQPDCLPVNRVVDEMRHLRERWGVRHFEFVDQCLRPEYLAQLSDALIDADLDVRWFCNGRTETGFTPELFGRMRRAGATMVMWGIESGSARLLKLMKKGVAPQGRFDILRAASDAGLFNFAYIFFGFPTETRDEAMQTVEMLCDNEDILHGYGKSVFSLGKHSPLIKDAERYGILRWVEDDQELSTSLNHEVACGLRQDDLAGVSESCTSVCRASRGDPLWMKLRSRETLHLYLAEHGREMVTSSNVAQPVESELVF